MSYKLEDIVLWYSGDNDIAKEFTLKQNVISDLFIQFLDGYKPPKTTKIVVELSDSDFMRPRFGSILNIGVQFDKGNFWSLSDKEQKKKILDTILYSVLFCSDKLNWDSKIFKKAYEKVVAVDYKYEFEFKKKLSPDKQHKASIKLEKNETHSTISAIFYDKSDNVIKTVELLKSFQDKMFYGGIIKNCKWFDNKLFGLYNSSKELTIQASYESDKPLTSIKPKTTSKDELEGLLRSITYREIKNQKDFKEWMNK